MERIIANFWSFWGPVCGHKFIAPGGMICNLLHFVYTFLFCLQSVYGLEHHLLTIFNLCQIKLDKRHCCTNFFLHTYSSFDSSFCTSKYFTKVHTEDLTKYHSEGLSTSDSVGRSFSCMKHWIADNETGPFFICSSTLEDGSRCLSCRSFFLEGWQNLYDSIYREQYILSLKLVQQGRIG